jgi:hypothetical protein
VQVAKNSETPISVKLERELAPSFLIKAGVPGATVRLDGNEVGVVKPDGTFAHEASPGTHIVKLEKPGYQSAGTEVALVVGSSTNIDLTMTPAAASADDAAYSAIADSTDTSALQTFLRNNPHSEHATQVRTRLEDLDWKSANRSDLASLDSFLKNYPQGQHASEARGLVADLQNEQGDFMNAMTATSVDPLQVFLTRHPKSVYAEQARQKITALNDRQAVFAVLHHFEEAYNRKDLDGIVAIYPSCSEGLRKVYRESFHSPEPQKLKLDLDEPDIQGIVASVKGKETRVGTLSSSSNFTAKLMKLGDRWIIQSGIY